MTKLPEVFLKIDVSIARKVLKIVNTNIATWITINWVVVVLIAESIIDEPWDRATIEDPVTQYEKEGEISR